MAQRRCAAAPWRPAAVSHCLTVHQASQQLPPPLLPLFPSTFALRNQFYDSSCAGRVFKINVSFLLPSQAVALGASLLFQTHTPREHTQTLTPTPHTHMNIGSECVPMIKCAALRIRNISFAMHLPMRIRPVSLLLIAHRHRPLWLHLCIDFCIDSILTNGRILLLYAQCTCLDSALSCGRK